MLHLLRLGLALEKDRGWEILRLGLGAAFWASFVCWDIGIMEF